MVKSIRLAAVAFMISSACHATEGFVMHVVNESNQVVAGLNLFPLDEDGSPIEDNLGGFVDPLLARQSLDVQIASACGPMLAVVVMGNGSELKIDYFDSCSASTLIVRR